MSKKNKILSIFTIVTFTLAFTSCVKDDDYTVPDSLGTEENARLNTLLSDIQTGNTTLLSVQNVKDLYQNATPAFIETSIAVKGYISSSDRTGNFFKEIYLQDAPENPTAGIKIILNQVDTYNQYNFGREVYIKLTGLYVGEERVGTGVIAIGGSTQTNQFGTTVKKMTENQRATSMFRSENTATIIPKTLTFSQVNASDIGLYVQFEGVEFADNLIGLQYFDPIQDFDTSRNLQSCGGIGYSTFNLETSSFASFKDVFLPTGNGTVSGVITKTFDGRSLVLALNEVNELNLTGPRCTPMTTEDFTVVFNEDFQSAVNNTILDFPEWTNFSEAGTFKWREKIFSGNGYAEFSSNGSGSVSNIAWLITPGIDMDAQDNEFLNFNAAQHHLDSPLNMLEVLLSTDYDGSNVLAATWTAVDAALPSQSNPWYQFVDSGLINLSSYSGTLYVAFKVVGSGTNTALDGAYQIDDLKILATN
ncbi:MAG: DUF5689 domain-containing protein [Aquaticitalea sp.]